MLQLLALLLCSAVALICMLALTAAPDRFSGHASRRSAQVLAAVVLAGAAFCGWQCFRHWDAPALQGPYFTNWDAKERSEIELQRSLALESEREGNREIRDAIATHDMLAGSRWKTMTRDEKLSVIGSVLEKSGVHPTEAVVQAYIEFTDGPGTEDAARRFVEMLKATSK